VASAGPRGSESDARHCDLVAGPGQERPIDDPKRGAEVVAKSIRLRANEGRKKRTRASDCARDAGTVERAVSADTRSGRQIGARRSHQNARYPCPIPAGGTGTGTQQSLRRKPLISTMRRSRPSIRLVFTGIARVAAFRCARPCRPQSVRSTPPPGSPPRDRRAQNQAQSPTASPRSFRAPTALRAMAMQDHDQGWDKKVNSTT